MISSVMTSSLLLVICILSAALAACPHSCSGNGVCTAGNCVCNSGWNGTDCSNATCDPACVNGVCQTPGNCNCSQYWQGSDCTTPICPNNCYSRGTCISGNLCSCLTGYTSNNCSQAICNQGCNYGTCVSPNNCVCTSGYQGASCSKTLCVPLDCQNGGTCASANGNVCLCSGQWGGVDCSVISSTTYPGNSIFTPDGTSQWSTSTLVRKFVPDASALPNGFTSQPSAAENCCPCGAFVQDGSCYFILNLPSSFPYMNPSTYALYTHYSCMQAGGQLATFEVGNSVDKMANFFKWLATDSNIQTTGTAVDTNSLCAVVGIYWDYRDAKFYWESNPPVQVASTLWYDGHPQYLNMACAIPHKQWPKLVSIDWWVYAQPVICMIRNPCGQGPICKPGTATTPGSQKALDRCVTAGNSNVPAASFTLVDRMAADLACKSQGGVLPSVRQFAEMRYWSFGLYTRSLSASYYGYPWSYEVWESLNHFTSDYYWDLTNKQLASPLHVDWDYAILSPNAQSPGRCTVASPGGWQDQSCSTSAHLACEGPLVDSNVLTTTTVATTTAGETVSTTTVTEQTTTAAETTTARASTTTTGFVQPGCIADCTNTPICPTGYSYSSCYDSCYQVVNTQARYLTALADCAADGATFVNFNSEGEFKYVLGLSTIDRTKNYFIGLQDWARRVSSNISVINGISVYPGAGDPDGNWCWMDDSGCIRNTNLIGNNPYWAPGLWSFLKWNLIPYPNHSGYHPFVAWIRNFGSNQWGIDMTDNNPTADFQAQQYYICEFNNACKGCPSGWTKFSGYCFQAYNTAQVYSSQVTACSAMTTSSNGVPTIWMPRTEGLVIFARMTVDYLSPSNQYFFIGIQKSANTAVWKWADGSNASLTDAFDIRYGHPSSYDTMITAATSWAQNVYDNQAGWIGYPSTSSIKTICQIPAVSGLWPSTSNCAAQCSASPTCPSGYSYVACFDSCYKVVNSATTYLWALQGCVNDGGTFVNFNTVEEMNYVMNLPAVSRSNKYFLGIQDWVRRTKGNISRVNSITYSGDPDGNWCWMDDSGCIYYQNLTVKTSGVYAAPGTWSFLEWIKQPIPQSNYHHPFLTWMTYNSSASSWRVDTSDSPNADFTASMPYICEVSNMCKGCPDGYVKYNTYCLQYNGFDNNPYDSMGCWTRNPPSIIWAPRTEGLLVYQRMAVDFFNSSRYFYIGLKKSSGTWRWADNKTATAQDAFDILTGQPGGSDDIFITGNGNQNPTNVYDGQQGWDGSSSTSPPGYYQRAYCQLNADPSYWPIAAASVTTTTPAPISCGSDCLTSVTCPLGYIYVPCYDSCYKVVSSTNKYLVALADCARDGGSFVNFNSQEEFDFVMANMPDINTNNKYFIGLQDWTRRARGSLTVINQITSYNFDPDGNWCWMDDSGCISRSSLTNTGGGLYAASSGPWSFLVWSARPSTPSSSGYHPFVTWIKYYSGQWRIDMSDSSPTADFQAQQYYICEINNACTVCPNGWTKYNSYCFKLISSISTTFANQVANCANMSTPNYGVPILWAPRTEGLLAYQRVFIDAIYPQYYLYIGLSKDSTNTWFWSDGSSASSQDAFDIYNSHPVYYQDCMFGVPSYTNIQNVYDYQGGWQGYQGTYGSARAVCQVTGISYLSSSTTTVGTTMVPTNCLPACDSTPICPNGYVYVSCYQSCYKIIDSNVRYLTALSECVRDGATFVNFNSEDEYNYVLSLATGNFYFIGLQDWTRRANGNLNMNSINNYAGDPDGTWCWMDDSGCISYTSLTASVSGSFSTADAWSFLSFVSNSGPNSNDNFIALLSNIAGSWLVTTSGLNFTYRSGFICEFNNPCASCPMNWTNYNGYCFQVSPTSWQNYDWQQAYCNGLHITNFPMPMVWAPKSEGLLVYQRMIFYLTQQQFIMGIVANSSGTWFWSDGTAVNSGDALDLKSGWQGTGTYSIMGQVDTSYAVTVRDQQNSWLGIGQYSGVTWRVCQIGTTMTSISTTTTTTTTPCVQDGCCPCGWSRYRDVANNNDICYLFVQNPMTWQDAQMYCAKVGSRTQYGAYLAVTDATSKISYLTSHPSWSNDSYWTALAINNYGVWTWPNTLGQSVSAAIVGSAALPTGSGCTGAVLRKSTLTVVPICETGNTLSSFPFICEIAMSLDSCLVCKPPSTSSGYNMTVLSGGTGRNFITAPLRVSPDKCVWIFQQSGTKTQDISTCSAVGLNPVNLYQAYENKLMRGALLTMAYSFAWIDLVMRNSTAYTWEGESSSWNYVRNTPTNNWFQACVSSDYAGRLDYDSCQNRRATVCTIPSAATCADLCPFGYTAIGGSCFHVETSAKVNDPFTARANCLQNFASYNLASLTSTTIVTGLVNLITGLQLANGTSFWIGLDDSSRIGHSPGTYNTITFAADPDGVWEMDITGTFPPSTLTNSLWAPGEPFPNNVWAMLVVNGTTASIVSTKPSLAPTAYYICERPQPCIQCDSGWTYFNGHCYYYYNTLAAGFRYLRGHCDFLKSYVVSIGSPIEWKFLSQFVGNGFWIGLYRSHGFLNNTKVDASNYHWDEGGRLSDTGFSALASFEPDFGGGITGSTTIGQFQVNMNWYDDPSYQSQTKIICEKSALIPTLQCPYVVASGVACGDNLVSPQYTDPTSGYTSSSYFATTNGSISMPANGLVLANPWCASPSDSSPWINIDFGSSPVYIRAIATLGGQTVIGMVTAYTVSYQETQGATSYTGLYVHKSVAPMTHSSTVVFAGNAVSTTRNSQEICPRIRAYGVKIVPLGWEILPVMRIELKGCATSVNVATFCECWVESFDISGWAGNYVTVNPYWWNENDADSFRTTPYNDWHRAYPQPSDYEINNGNSLPTAIYGWTPNTVDSQIWWKVMFKVLKMITGFVMRGNSQYNEYITSYYVMWSHTGYEYTFNYYYALDGSPRLFAGPTSANAVTQQTFCPPMKALQLKVIPNTWVTNPTLVVDIFACMARGQRCYDCCDEIGLCNCNCPVGWTGAACATVANDRNYYIDAQAPVCESTELLAAIASSVTYFATSGVAANGNANSGLAWIPVTSDPFHYWQVDFGKVMSISMVRVGAGSTGFFLGYYLWFMVQGSRSMLFYPLLQQQNNPQSSLLLVPGARGISTSYNTPYRLCPNIRTQALRFQPNTTTAVGTNPAMRFFVNGCPAHASCSSCCTYTDGCQCKCPVGYATNYQSAATPNPWEHCDEWEMMPIDCEDLALRSPNLPSGVYVIYPPAQSPISVYCDMTSYGGGWTMIQNRYDSTLDFSKKWIDYRNGFGDLNANFWLGNENIRIITSSVNSYQLLIALTTSDSQLGLAYYNKFYLGSEASGYVLNLGSIDSCQTIGDSLINHVGNRFYTRDNDTTAGPYVCAANAYGGWWYRVGATDLTSCHDSNINGLLQTTSTPGQMATWKTWRGYSEPMVTTKMMIRRTPLPNVLQPLQPHYIQPADCEDILDANPSATSGVYTITPLGSSTPVSVYCEMVALGGGWTVIQRHYDYSLNFNRNYTEYVNGFGSLLGNHWLGLSAMNSIVNWQSSMVVYQLAVVLEDTTGEKRTSIYPSFYFGNSVNYQLLSTGPQSGVETAGDGLYASNGAPFQTPDSTFGWPCASIRPGGWWFRWQYYSNCAYGNLNGPYGNNTLEWGMYWHSWKGRYESLKAATMMVKAAGPKPIDCQDIDTAANNSANSGPYWIFPYGAQPIQVYCDFGTSWYGNSGWTVIQRRKWGNIAFSRTWLDYKTGFWANPAWKSGSDFWLGNDNMYSLTKSAAYSLLVTIKDPTTSTKLYAFYSDFKILSENDGYLLFVQGYDNTHSTAPDSLSWNSLSTFSTYNNGTHASCVNNYYPGGWWYPRCNLVSNLNGDWNSSIYGVGMFWQNVGAWNMSLLETQMAIIRKPAPSVINLPFASTTSLCGNLGVVQHSCQHTYQPITGDSIRLMDSTTPAIYSGTDLLCKPYATPRDCSYFQSTSNSSSSKFFSSTRSDLYVQSMNTFTSYCDQETMGGGWTIIQHRVDGTQTFQLDTTAYQLPFGSASSNFWLGNNLIQALTASANYELLVEVKTNLSYGFALYNLFYTTSNVFQLHLGTYKTCSTAGNSLSNSQGRPFIQDASCSGAGWWFHTSNPCIAGAGNATYPTSNLNAPYGPQSPTYKNIYWWTFGNGFAPNLMTTWMKIRRPGTYGRYITASNFVCNVGNSATITPILSATSCQSTCTSFSSFTCISAVYDRNTTCILRDASCSPPSQGYVDYDYDTYFRMDSCSMVSTCGPPPAMYGTNMEVVNMPGNMSVNYTCRPGFSNALWKGDNTVLTCDPTSRRWLGQWLDCRTLCGDIPDLTPFNAIITPTTAVEGGSVTLYYACQPDYELIYGDLTRVCAPPYGAWTGGAVFCNTTRCSSPPTVPYSWNNYTVPVVISDLTRRYTVWNYTCNYGYVFIESLTKWNTITCQETKLWVPSLPGTCVPLRCESPPIFSNVIITPPINNFTYFEGGFKIKYQCLNEKVLDPQNWDSNVTISCVGNETWSVINYAGSSHTWLPSLCVGNVAL